MADSIQREGVYRNRAAESAAESPRSVSRLPDELSNQIAAGEVVERPSSVVKELVENSLDAGAQHLVVTIEEGGRELVRVRDDGTGMRREDALRALERHATSKVRDAEDLTSISTLGFRGEALPSIGAVSRMEIKTKPHDELAGIRLLVEGGELKEVEDTGIKAGTSVTVRDLFFNTPARRKFLKQPSTEARRITEMLVRMSLSRPDVRFKLQKDDSVRLDLPAVEDVQDRILEVLGRDVYDDMYETYEYPAVAGVVARGYFTEPSHTQRTSKNIYVFVNGRYVEDRMIMAAIKKSYGSLLEGGRYPSVVLYIEVPFDNLDVNVHPMKTEVRFHDTQPVFRAVYHAIADALAEAPWVEGADDEVYELNDGGRSASPGEEGGGSNNGGDAVSPNDASFEPLNARHRRKSEQGPSWRDKRKRPDGEGASQRQNGAGDEVPSPFYESNAGGEDDDRQRGFSAAEASPLRNPPTRTARGEPGDAPPEADRDGDAGYFSSLRVIGQFKRMYIVCEDASGMVIIDQHAAHERIGFERLRRWYHESAGEQQPKLFGQRLELDAVRADVLSEYLDFFEEAGFHVEPFGGQSFALKSAPAFLEGADHEALIKDALDDLADIGRSDKFDEQVDAILSRMACHSVVRGPTDLDREESEALLEQMDEIDFKANCPHGRPVYYRIPTVELEKSFDRK